MLFLHSSSDLTCLLKSFTYYSLPYHPHQVGIELDRPFFKCLLCFSIKNSDKQCFYCWLTIIIGMWNLVVWVCLKLMTYHEWILFLLRINVKPSSQGSMLTSSTYKEALYMIWSQFTSDVFQFSFILSLLSFYCMDVHC